jgi:hypothetical protein
MLPSIEQHVRWIGDCIATMQSRQARRIEAVETTEATGEPRQRTRCRFLFPSCNSWYLGANVPGKLLVFMPYSAASPPTSKCNEVASHDYEGFTLVDVEALLRRAYGSPGDPRIDGGRSITLPASPRSFVRSAATTIPTA